MLNVVKITEQWGGGWFGRQWHRCAARFRQRAQEIAQAHDGRCLMVTLTLDPSRYKISDPAGIYDQARRERWVALYIRALRKATGVDFDYVMKIEFHASGAVHWHLLFYGIGFIDGEVLYGKWGRGIVNVSRARPDKVHYLAKYASKGNDTPGWVLDRDTRAVRLTSSSRRGSPAPVSPAEVGTRQSLASELARPRQLGFFDSVVPELPAPLGYTPAVPRGFAETSKSLVALPSRRVNRTVRQAIATCSLTVHSMGGRLRLPDMDLERLMECVDINILPRDLFDGRGIWTDTPYETIRAALVRHAAYNEAFPVGLDLLQRLDDQAPDQAVDFADF